MLTKILIAKKIISLIELIKEIQLKKLNNAKLSEFNNLFSFDIF